jgi:flagellar protein FlbD
VIRLTKLNAKPLELDPDSIERVEVCSDAVLTVTMVDGARHVVKEGLREVVSLVTDYQAGLLAAHEIQTSLPSPPTRLVARPARSKDPAGSTRDWACHSGAAQMPVAGASIRRVY